MRMVLSSVFICVFVLAWLAWRSRVFSYNSHVGTNGAVIETQNLRRIFGDLVAVDDLNLRVDRGQFYGFLGPNGAGKSTTIRMLTGLLQPSSGGIRILSLDMERDS